MFLKGFGGLYFVPHDIINLTKNIYFYQPFYIDVPITWGRQAPLVRDESGGVRLVSQRLLS